MINRRNIRVKVMQTLYTMVALETETRPGDAVKILQKHFEQTRQLFIYLTYFLSEVANYAQVDAQSRASKHLPTYNDLHVNLKLTGNEILSKIREDASFNEFAGKDKPELLSKDLISEAIKNSELYPYLFLFENCLRKLIIKVLYSKYGKDWWNTQIKNEN